MEIKCKECNKNMEVYNKYNHKLKMEMGHVKLFRFDIPIHMYFEGDDKNNEYTLCLCEDCCKKYFEKKWKGVLGVQGSKRFYNPNSLSKAVYNIPDDEYNIIKTYSKKKYGMTLNKMIEKYGEEEGQKKWDNYCKRQSETNTYEYKKEKYGWTKEQFDEYNASRAVTKENLIKRWGEEEGLRKWDKYVDRQVETKSKDYVVEKYGEDYWVELCKKKALTLETFIRKWGEEEGKKRYEKFYENLVHRAEDFKSVASKFCFKRIIEYLNINYSKEFNYTFNDNNVLYYSKEISKICGNKVYYLDCYFKDFNIDIEYNGDIFHGNPKLYKDDTRCNFFSPELTAKDLQEKDNIRYGLLKEYHDIDTLVIWEYDYNINKEWTIENFVDNTLVPLLRKKNKLKNQN